MKHWLWIIPLLLLACWLGSQHLNDDSVWWDEYASMRDAGLLTLSPDGWTDIWLRVGTGNPWHVPGFFMLLNGWSRFVGAEPALLRAFALLVGLLAIALTYRLGRALVSPEAGIYAAAIVASSAFFVYYLHELRMYTLFALLTAFTLWVYLRIVRARHVSRWLWLGLFVGALGLLYTHYFAALLLGVIGLYHLSLFFTPRGRALGRRWWQVLGVLAAAGVLFAPWLGFLFDALGRASSADELRSRALGPLETLERLGYLFSNGAWWLLLVLLLLAAYAALRSVRVRRAWFFAGGLLVMLLVANAVLQVMHGGRLRYLMALWPLVAVLVGAGIAFTGRRFALPLLALWLAFGVFNSGSASFGDVDGTQPRFPIHRAAQIIRPASLPSDTVLTFVTDLAYRSEYLGAFYYGNIPLDYVFVKGRRELGVDFARFNGEEGDHISLESALSDERLWLATMPGQMPRGVRELTRAIADDYALCRSVDDPAVSVALYAISPVCCLTENPPLRLRFGEGIGLAEGDYFPAEAGDSLPVMLLWSITGEVVPHAYSVSLQIFDESGEKVAQVDYGLEAQAFTCRRSALDIASLPPGDYEVRTTVYAWQTGERLPGTVLATGEMGELLPLGSFRKS